MNDSIKHLIEESIGTGEVLEIIYLGGSHPGVKRRVVFQKLEDNGDKVRVVDLNEPGVAKVFFINKIFRPEDLTEEEISRLVPDYSTKDFNTLQELYDECSQKVLLREYELEFVSESQKLNVYKYRFFKNGNKRRKLHFSLYFQEFVTDYSICESGELIDIQKPAQRPWAIGNKRFSRFPKAAKEFLKLFKECIQK